MGEKRKTTVYFGGTAYEQWTERGLEVTYSGRTAVLAEGEGEDMRAEAPEPQRALDVKAGYNELAKCLELAMRLNAGATSPLSQAYFRAAAEVARALEDHPDWRTLPAVFRKELSGGMESIAMIELLRLLLDERRAGWDEAVAIVARLLHAAHPLPAHGRARAPRGRRGASAARRQAHRRRERPPPLPGSGPSGPATG